MSHRRPLQSESRTGEKGAAHREEEKVAQVRLMRIDSHGEDLLVLSAAIDTELMSFL